MRNTCSRSAGEQAPRRSEDSRGPGVGVDDSQIEDHVILTRLDPRLAPTATVAQLNAALRLVEGGIISMARGFAGLTVAVPRQRTSAIIPV